MSKSILLLLDKMIRLKKCKYEFCVFKCLKNAMLNVCIVSTMPFPNTYQEQRLVLNIKAKINQG